MSNRPNFLIVGVPKAGTSSLYSYLKQHPEIFLPDQKELHYFTHQELNQSVSGPGDKLGLKSIIDNEVNYFSLYKNALKEKSIGDVSPSYFFFSEKSIPRIKKTLSEHVKIIILLRDPIDRSFSNFLHQKKLLHEELTFDLALKQESNRKMKGFGDFWRYTEHSIYFEKCHNFLREFGADNVKIVLFEDLVESSDLVIKNICEFLNVDRNYDFKDLEKIHNQGGVYKRNRITEFFLKPTHFKQFIQNIVGKKCKQLYKSFKRKVLESNTEIRPKIEPTTLIQLKTLFNSDIKNLKSLDIDLSKWKNFH